MKKPKSINFSLVVLTLLFILSQTAFALSANLSSEQREMGARQDGILAVATAFKSYDMDTEGNRILTASNPINEDIDISSVPETFLTFQGADSIDQAIAQIENTPVAKQEIKSVVRYVDADMLNVRLEANSESKLVTTVKRGDKVSFYETQGEWARITTWTDKKGYILEKYLVDREKDVKKDVKQVVVVEKKTATVSRSASEKTAASQPATEAELSLAEKIVTYAKSLQGVKYVYGGYSTKGLDCSGLTKFAFAKYNISVPRSAGEYWGFGTKVARADLRVADIVLFDTDGGTADVSHVGIYVGSGNFIHASTTKGKVIIMNLAAYRGKYMGARRVIK